MHRTAGPASSPRLAPILIVLGLLGCSDGTAEPQAPRSREECLGRADFGPPTASPYCLPFAEGSAYAVVQSYCAPPPGSHVTRFAYDFNLPMGTEVLNAREGVVVELREHWPDDNRTGGQENMVSLRHADETISLYIHMKQDGVLVELGDTVPRGGLLGWSGASGDPTGYPHLHFMVCLRGGICSSPNEVTLPVNFNNAIGPLDSNQGLVVGETYTAGRCTGQE